MIRQDVSNVAFENSLSLAYDPESKSIEEVVKDEPF